MATITEDYVSFETARLLKEKGFNEPCLMCYTSDKKLGNYGHYNSYKNSDVFSLTAPTIQMAMKWLREAHKLSIEPYYDIVLSWVVDIKYIGKYINYKEFEEVRSQAYNSYEEAVEAALKYTLENLI